MKRTIGWMLAAMMSAPACAQQTATAPKETGSGGEAGGGSGGGVVIIQDEGNPPGPNQQYKVRSGTVTAGQGVTVHGGGFGASGGGSGGGGFGGGGAFGSTDSGGGVIKEPWPMYFESRAGSGRITVTPGGDGKQLTITSDVPGYEQYRALRGYLSTIDQYSRSNRDATTTAVAAVMQAAEMLRPKGADAEIAYFNKVLGGAQNATVRRAIRLQLIDAYKRAGQIDKALDELKTIILEAPEKGK